MDDFTRSNRTCSADIIASLDAKIDRNNADIQRLQISNIHLKRERNALQPISRRLPPEILLYTFEFLHPRFCCALPLDALANELWDWLILTKICYYWRNLIINTPDFWSSIMVLGCMEKIGVFLERSQNAKIDIYLINPEVAYYALKLIKEHWSRARKLYVASPECSIGEGQGYDNSIWRQALWYSLKDLFTDSDSCPYLKELILIEDRELNVSFQVDPTRVFYKPLDLDWLTNCETWMKLDKLELTGIRVPWNSPLLCGLRALTLKLRLDEEYCPQLSELLHVLGQCSTLRELEFDRVRPIFPLGTQVKLVDLPHLNSLVLTNIVFNDYMALFTHIQLSAEQITSCTVSCSGYDFDTANAIIPKSLGLVIPFQFKVLEVVIREDYLEFSLRWFKDKLQSNCLFRIRLIFPTNRFHTEAPFFTTIIRSIPPIIRGDYIRNVEKIDLYFKSKSSSSRTYLDRATRADDKKWATLFSGIPELGLLSIDCNSTNLFLRIFKVLFKLARDSSCSSQAREIHIAGIESMNPRSKRLFDKLMDYLRIRKVNGFPLSILKLHKCRFSDEELKKLWLEGDNNTVESIIMEDT